MCRGRSRWGCELRHGNGSFACGFLEATLDFALDHPETGAWLNRYIREKAKTL